MNKGTACPTRGGSYTAYLPEYRFVDWKDNLSQDWTPIAIFNVEEGTPGAVPGPIDNKHINSAIGLLGYEQAMAIKWQYEAKAASLGHKVETRLVTYFVDYDIRAYKKDEDEIG